MFDPDVQQFLPTLHQRSVLAFLALIGGYWILRLVRRHRLQEEHALILFVGIAAGLVILLCDPLLVLLTTSLGIKVPASAFLLLTVFFLFITCVQLSSIVSVQKRELAQITLRLSILQMRIEEAAGPGRASLGDGSRDRGGDSFS